MAEFAAEQSAQFVYISTDYVYDGTKDGVYEVYDTVNPQSVYGTTKLAGERIVQELIPETHFIIRTSWVFGNSPLQTGNFVKTMIGLSENRKEINVVNDQIGSPTYALDLAKLIVAMIQTDEYGIYHATNEGFCSWYDFACEILKDKQIKINPVSSEQYPTLAVRPKNSRLSKQKLTEHGFTRLASWQDALERYKNTL